MSLKLRRRQVALSPSKKLKILAEYGFRCFYCGRDPRNDQVKLVVDHVNPKSNGGGDDDENLVPACRECNAGKSAKILNPNLVESLKDGGDALPLPTEPFIEPSREPRFQLEELVEDQWLNLNIALLQKFKSKLIDRVIIMIGNKRIGEVLYNSRKEELVAKWHNDSRGYMFYSMPLRLKSTEPEDPTPQEIPPFDITPPPPPKS
ncbi:MAG: HNH endonuclease [Candidatus Omnitrophota bacterium]